MAYRTWEQLTHELAARLTRLADGDTVRLAAGPYFAMLQQAPDFLRLETASAHTLPPDRQLTAGQVGQLRALGWQEPDLPGDPNFWVELDWPLSGAQAVRAAAMVVGALRDVYGLDRVDRIEEKAFNAFS